MSKSFHNSFIYEGKDMRLKLCRSLSRNFGSCLSKPLLFKDMNQNLKLSKEEFANQDDASKINHLNLDAERDEINKKYPNVVDKEKLDQALEIAA